MCWVQKQHFSHPYSVTALHARLFWAHTQALHTAAVPVLYRSAAARLLLRSVSAWHLKLNSGVYVQILAIFPAYHLRFPPVFRKILELFSVFNFNMELVGSTALVMAFMRAVPQSAWLPSSIGADAAHGASSPALSIFFMTARSYALAPVDMYSHRNPNVKPLLACRCTQNALWRGPGARSS